MRRHPQVHVQVTRLAAPRAGSTAAGEAQGGAAVDAGGHVDLIRLVDRDTALAAAGRTRGGDHLAHAATAAARTRGDHLTQQALTHPLHLAAPAAVAAGDGLRPGSGAGTAAVVAGDRELQGDVDLIAEHRLFEGDVGDDLEILPARGAGRPAGPAATERALATTEERLEDVAEATAEQILRRWTTATTGSSHARFAVAVVARPLIVVGENLVRLRHFLEPVGARGVAGVRVGMQLAGPLAICLLDLVRARRARHAEEFVIVSHGPLQDAGRTPSPQPSSMRWANCSLTTSTVASASG